MIIFNVSLFTKRNLNLPTCSPYFALDLHNEPKISFACEEMSQSLAFRLKRISAEGASAATTLITVHILCLDRRDKENNHYNPVLGQMAPISYAILNMPYILVIHLIIYIL